MKVNNSNSQQALWVALGSFTSFGVSIISSMILSRYFDKGDYGTYKQVMYIYNTLLIVFTLGLPQSFGYFLPRVAKEQGKDVVNKITGVFFIMGAVFSLFLYFASSQIAAIMKNPDLSGAIRIFSLVPFFLLPTMGIESIYSTYRKTYISSIYTVVSRLIIIICVILPVILINGTYTEAIYGFTVASAISFIVALYLKNMPFRGLVNTVSNVSIKDIFKFSLPLMVAGLWGLIIHSADQFFISRYFGPNTFAEFSNGAMELPFVGMILSACTTVLYPLFSKINNEHLDPKDTIFPIWLSVFKKTAMIIYPMIAYCWIFSDDIMILLYGDSYEISGLYFKIKLIGNLFTLIAFAPVILSIGETKYYAKVHMYSAIILVVLEYLIVELTYNPYYITAVSVICLIGRIFALLFLISKYFGVKIIDLFPMKLMIKIIIPSLFFLSVLKYYILMQLSSIQIILISLPIYVIIYLLYSWLVGINYIRIIKPMISK